MTYSPRTLTELHELIGALCDGAIDAERFAQLQDWLNGNVQAQRFYVRYLDLYGALRRLSMERWSGETDGNAAEGNEPWVVGSEDFISSDPFQALDQHSFPVSAHRAADGDRSETTSASALPHPRHFPAFLSTTLHGTIGYFSQEVPFSLLIAAVVTGLALWIGSLLTVSRDVQISQQPTSPVAEPSRFEQIEYVGRITGMADCKWADPNTATMNGVKVRLGRKFALASGLMEITYDSGAKVILQGPVTYEVESNGGYLSVGKLTGKLEKKNDEGKSETRTRNDEKLQNSSFVIRPSSFVIRTPTATVTDLGTEFGVEVDKQGGTTSHVFRGLVRVRVLGDGAESEGASHLLRENESARVGGGQDNRKIVVLPSAKPAEFIREIPKRTIKTLDLVDVVAGGDGFGKARDRGIDPTTGQVAHAQIASKEKVILESDGRYHRVASLPMVDGVFIPDDRAPNVQVDSAGHVFADFLTSDHRTAGYLWAGGSIPSWGDQLLPTTLNDVDYSLPGHGVLSMHANKGITFDLEAVRRANAGWKVVRFRAVAGDTETISLAEGYPLHADLWVLVDGQMRFRRRGINGASGAFSIVVPIGEKDRFLTLAATDGGDSILGDWVMFGEPVLEMSAIDGKGSTP